MGLQSPSPGAAWTSIFFSVAAASSAVSLLASLCRGRAASKSWREDTLSVDFRNPTPPHNVDSCLINYKK